MYYSEHLMESFHLNHTKHWIKRERNEENEEGKKRHERQTPCNLSELESESESEKVK